MKIAGMSEAAAKLTVARVNLQKRFPFYGYLALKLKLVEDEKIGTAGVDGKGKMFYAPSFIMDKSTDELIWLWAHEIGHLIFEHVSRKGSRNHMLWNMAGDYAINLLITKDGVGKMIEDCLYDEKYAGWTAAQIYDDLLKDAKANAEKYQQMMDDGVGDNHSMWDELSDEEKEAVGKQWQREVISAAHAAKQAGGEVPEAFRDLIIDLTTTKISWRDMVREKIKCHNKEDVSWSKVNRRRALGDFNYPGKAPGEKVSFMVALDTSGSFSQDQINDAMSEVFNATREFEEVTIDVIQWDTKTYGHKTFTQENSQEMLSYQMMGGGGTDFNCVIDWMRENNKTPNQLFVFTDLYFSYMDDPGICYTMFIVSGGNNASPPFGERVDYD